MRIQLFFVLLMLTVSFPASAKVSFNSYMRGIDLLSMCRNKEMNTKVITPSFCETYVAGVIDVHNMMRSMDFTTPVTFCIPEQYSIQQVTEIVLNDLAASPQHDHFVAAPAVTLALFKAFPCKTKK